MTDLSSHDHRILLFLIHAYGAAHYNQRIDFVQIRQLRIEGSPSRFCESVDFLTDPTPFCLGPYFRSDLSLVRYKKSLKPVGFRL